MAGSVCEWEGPESRVFVVILGQLHGKFNKFRGTQ
jgi:hypothetical protein